MSPAPNTTLPLYDYVIVGGGTAGCLLANRLSANRSNAYCFSKRVVVIIGIGSTSPLGTCFVLAMRAPTGVTKTQPEPGLNGRSILYARGKTLGGSSAINAMIYMRGQRRDYGRVGGINRR